MNHFEKIYYDQIENLFNYGRMICKDPAVVEDCIQDLFADLWERKDTMDKIVNIRSYLMGALRRKVMRKLYKNKEVSVSDEEKAKYFEFLMEKTSEEDFEAEEKQLHLLRSAFQNLTFKQKEVIYLRFYNQLSYNEIGEVMEVQTRTVYKIAHRAVLILRKYVLDTSQILFLMLAPGIFL